jgi:thiol-disulfide isomerase/thioredoxin
MRTLLLAGAWLGIVAGLAIAQDESLTIGSPAPELTVSKWVKGEAIEGFDKEKVYVVEFWATWCGPCRTSIPHLTELQKEYADKGVDFIGVSVWEDEPEGVEPFVEEMGEKMEYRVAKDSVPEGKDGSEGAMATAWMKASESNGIPTAFVVKDGQIAWIGHPMEMDKPLEQIVAGTYDIAAAAAERAEARAQEAKMAELMEKLAGPLRSEKFDKALEIIDEALEADPKLVRGQLGMLKFELLGQAGDAAKKAAFGATLVEAFEENAAALNFIAWSLIDPEKEEKPGKDLVELALKAATKASTLQDEADPAILDTLGLAQFLSGDAKAALATQEKAVKLMGEDELDPSIKERLEQYREAVEAADKK